MNDIVRQNGDTIVPHLTGAPTLCYPAHVGQMFTSINRHLRQLMDRSNSHTLYACMCVFLKPFEELKIMEDA